MNSPTLKLFFIVGLAALGLVGCAATNQPSETEPTFIIVDVQPEDEEIKPKYLAIDPLRAEITNPRSFNIESNQVYDKNVAIQLDQSIYAYPHVAFQLEFVIFDKGDKANLTASGNNIPYRFALKKSTIHYLGRIVMKPQLREAYVSDMKFDPTLLENACTQAPTLFENLDVVFWRQPAPGSNLRDSMAHQRWWDPVKIDCANLPEFVTLEDGRLDFEATFQNISTET